MSEEVGSIGTGERGTFRLEKAPQPERAPSPYVHDDERHGSGIRGWFRFDKSTGECISFTPEAPKAVNAPYVQTDEIAPTMSMTGTDNIHTSKRKLRAEYKALGFIEVGTSIGTQNKIAPWGPSREQINDHLRQALNACKYGDAPLTEMERERCRREERAYQAYVRRIRAGLRPRKVA